MATPQGRVFHLVAKQFDGPLSCYLCRSKVRAQEDRAYAGGLRLAVKRSTVFEDSFNKLRSRAPAEMRGKLSVSFVGEEGIDAGGVSREWYQVRMFRMCANPCRPLLTCFVVH